MFDLLHFHCFVKIVLVCFNVVVNFDFSVSVINVNNFT
jgi:hypothetical protein